MLFVENNTFDWYVKTVEQGTHCYERVILQYYELLTRRGSTPAMLEDFERSLKRFHDFQMQTQENHTRFLKSLPYDAIQFSEHRRHELVRIGKAYWRRFWGIERWLGEYLFFRLFQHFVGDVLIEDQKEFSLLKGKPVLYLANHQVAIESLLFSLVIPVLTESPVHAIAKIEHRTSWISQLLGRLYSYPGLNDPEFIFFFDREKPASMSRLLNRIKEVMLKQQHSLLVHVQGTRAVSSRQSVTRLSAVFLDLAMGLEVPIVPVAFTGGLPGDPLEKRLEFPIGYTCQNYHLGRPIFTDRLKALPHAERKTFVMERINRLSHPFEDSGPHHPDKQFEQKVQEAMAQYPMSETQAVLCCLLAEEKADDDEMMTLLDGIRNQEFQVPATPESEWLLQFAQWLCEEQVSEA